MGTTNFGDDVFMNPWPFVAELYQLSQEREVVPEFELFDLGHVAALHRLLDAYGLPYGGKVHCDLVMGVPGGMPGTADALVAAVQALPAETTSWSATGIGRTTLAVALASLSKGGHLRVGMEDTLTFARGVPVDAQRRARRRAAARWPSWPSVRRCRPPTPASSSRSSSASHSQTRHSTLQRSVCKEVFAVLGWVVMDLTSVTPSPAGLEGAEPPRPPAAARTAPRGRTRHRDHAGRAGRHQQRRRVVPPPAARPARLHHRRTERGNARERWWQAAHQSTYADNTADTPDERQTIDAYLQSVAMVYTQNLQAHIEERDTLSDEWRRASTLSDYYLRLSPAKARAVVQQLHALLQEVHESTIDRDGDDGATGRRRRRLHHPVQRLPASAAADCGPVMTATTMPATKARSRTPLVGYLVAEAISLVGTRLSMIAIPWLVLVTTGSPAKTGLVAFAELAPLVAIKAGAGPLIDRVGARRVAIGCDLASVVVVGLIPLLHAMDSLTFGVLLVLVALGGALRGPGDGAKSAFVPALTAHSGVPLERVTGLSSAIERSSTFFGAAAAGLLVALVGPANALALDALSFGVCAAVFGLSTRGMPSEPVEDRPPGTSYLEELRGGWNYLRTDAVLVGLCVMVATTNLLDIAFTTVLVPVWAHDNGMGVGAVGTLFSVWAAFSVVGALLAAWLGPRLRRFPTYVVAFLITGAAPFPRAGLRAADERRAGDGRGRRRRVRIPQPDPRRRHLRTDPQALDGSRHVAELRAVLVAHAVRRHPRRLPRRRGSVWRRRCSGSGSPTSPATMLPLFWRSFREFDQRPVEADDARRTDDLGQTCAVRGCAGAGPSVDEGLDALGEHLVDVRRRAADHDAGQQVGLGQVAASSALGANGDPAGQQEQRHESVERRGVRELELLRVTGHGHPDGLAGEPDRDSRARADGCRGDREALVGALRVVGARGDLDHERTARRACGHARSVAATDTVGAVEAFYVSLLVLVGVFIAWFAGYVVYQLFRGQRLSPRCRSRSRPTSTRT